MKPFLHIIVFSALFFTSHGVTNRYSRHTRDVKPERLFMQTPKMTPEYLSQLHTDALGCANIADEFDMEKVCFYYNLPTFEANVPHFCHQTPITCDPKLKYRNHDGSCNNLAKPWLGTPNATYFRLLPSRYADGQRLPRVKNDGSPLPGARIVRTTLFPMGTGLNRLWNINSLIYGQFIAHDLSLLRTPPGDISCCDQNGIFLNNKDPFCYPIKIPSDDPTMGKAGHECMNFTRTFTNWDLECGGRKFRDKPAEQINTVTDHLDLSPVYGLNHKQSRELRSLKGGKLKVQIINGREFPPMEKDIKSYCPCNVPFNEKICFKTGDSRANQNPSLVLMQTIFLREHNRIAAELAALNPCWNDEKLYQETRRILIAVHQKMAYNDYFPIFLGFENAKKFKLSFKEGYVNDYDPKVDCRISQEFAHGAFRFFHSQIDDFFRLFDSNFQTTKTVPLHTVLHRPSMLMRSTNIQEFTRCMLRQNIHEVDHLFSGGLNDKLFACEKPFGIDMKATDIQRDRDHGLAYYNDYRAYCNLTKAKSWDDFADFITPANITLLKTLYKNFEDVDLSVGGSLERLAPDSQFGPTFECLMKEQLLRTRRGDRFWFEHPEAGFTKEQLAEIRNQTMSRMFCDNADDVTEIQPFAFTLLLPFNKVKKCTEIPKMSLLPWKDPTCAVSKSSESDYGRYSHPYYY